MTIGRAAWWRSVALVRSWLPGAERVEWVEWRRLAASTTRERVRSRARSTRPYSLATTTRPMKKTRIPGTGGRSRTSPATHRVQPTQMTGNRLAEDVILRQWRGGGGHDDLSRD